MRALLGGMCSRKHCDDVVLNETEMRLLTEKQTAVSAEGLPPLLVSAAQAGALVCVNRSTWTRWSAAGKIPAPIRIGGAVRWSYAELQEWIKAGCPGRVAWIARKGAEVS